MAGASSQVYKYVADIYPDFGADSVEDEVKDEVMGVVRGILERLLLEGVNPTPSIIRPHLLDIPVLDERWNIRTSWSGEPPSHEDR